MTGLIDEIVQDLVTASHILSREGVLDIFGHVSVRHPEQDGCYMLSRARSPAIITADDILTFDFEGAAIEDSASPLFAERVIHAAIYTARPDVHAVCHLHAAPVLPFAITGEPLVPAFHVGAVVGTHIPFWDIREDFGDTDMLVSTLEQAQSLARALGPDWAVLMRRHGATVVGCSLRELTMRAVSMVANARTQLDCRLLGTPDPLTPKEIELAGELNLRPSIQQRAWDYWTSRLGG